MSVRIIADAQQDEAAWLEARRNYLTGSDIFTWLGDVPKWWSSTRAGVLQSKLSGVDPTFPITAQRKMAHGKFDEENNRLKFCEMTGLSSTSWHKFVSNDRWPRIGATLDGLIHTDVQPEPPNFVYASDQNKIDDAILRALARPERTGVLEMKQTMSRKGWAEGVPYYYLPQVQAQLWVANYEWAIACAQVGADDMTCYFIERDPAFAEVLDSISEELEEIWKK